MQTIHVELVIFINNVMCMTLCASSRWVDVKEWLDKNNQGFILNGKEVTFASKRSKGVFFAPTSFLGQHKSVRNSEISKMPFGLSKDETLEIVDSVSTIEASKVLKVQERYKGILVYDAAVTAEIDNDDDHFTGQVSGHVLNEIENDIVNVEPSICREDVIKLMAEKYSAENYSSLHADLYVFKNPHEEMSRLTWRVSFFFKDDMVPSRPTCFIDAHSGEILYCYDTLRRFKINAKGGNERTGALLYGVDMPRLNVQRKNGKCRYKSDEVKVFDNRDKMEETNGDKEIAEFDCDEGIFDEVNGAYSPATDAYFFGKMTVQMIKQWTGAEACKLSPLELYVHEEGDHSAYFDGTVFRFSDGDSDTYPYTTAGIIGHEIGHCFSESHADLKYSDQSGGIDEAFSDLVGEAVKYFIFGHNDWKAGSDVLKENGEYVRYMCDQAEDGMSLTHMDQYNSEDKKDVHFLSGIFNKVACELSKAKGWDTKLVFQVFTHANRFYWHPSSGFSEAACGVLKSTYDLGHTLSDVENAFSKVGIQTCNTDGYMRKIVPNSIIKNLKASMGEHIIFKIQASKVSPPYNVEIKTSYGFGDVDLYVSADPNFTVNKTIYSSTNVGNFETIALGKTDYFTPVYLLLKPHLFAFTGVTLSVTDS